MHAKIAKTRRSKQGIADCVEQNIRVGMTEQTFLVGNFNPADDQFASRNQFVDIVADSDAHKETVGAASCGRINVEYGNLPYSTVYPPSRATILLRQGFGGQARIAPTIFLKPPSDNAPGEDQE